jgi:two-component system OmpR family response regulator
MDGSGTMPDALTRLPRDGGAVRILLVEDDTETAAYVTRGLEEAGHVVDRAADGQDGLFLATGGGRAR